MYWGVSFRMCIVILEMSLKSPWILKSQMLGCTPCSGNLIFYSPRLFCFSVDTRIAVCQLIIILRQLLMLITFECIYIFMNCTIAFWMTFWVNQLLLYANALQYCAVYSEYLPYTCQRMRFFDTMPSVLFNCCFNCWLGFNKDNNRLKNPTQGVKGICGIVVI